MNYRHAFHAGNFADLVKHAILLDLLNPLTARAAPPLTVIDTHAGAGLYDLAGPEATRTGEGAGGVGRLMASETIPSELESLAAAVRDLGWDGGARLYPGSPLLIAGRLRPGDRLLACEVEGEPHAALRRALRRLPVAELVESDGWRFAARRAPRAPASLLVLIDPPYEANDDAAQAAALIRRLAAINPRAVTAVWAPIKNLAGFDAFSAALEDAAGRAPVLVAEARIRPLTDPMRLNGCAMIVVNPPAGLAGRAKRIVDWVAGTLGEGGAGRVRGAGCA